MKSIAVVLILALAAFGVVAAADAQTGNSPAGTQAPAPPAASSDSSASSSVSTPRGGVQGQVDIDRRSDAQAPPRTDATRTDDGSALPRSVVTERTTIFGLSPTAALVIAAALLVVVILSIVAMTRSNDTYIER
jgi:hypothetical protein